MPRLDINLKPNEFFTTNAESVLVNILDKHQNLDIDYGYIFLGYPNWHQPHLDLFQYFDEIFLDKLINTKTCLLVDYTYEGFSYVECPIIKILEENCDRYKVDPKKIFYFSGNLRDISNKINAIPIFTLDYPNNFSKYNNDIENIKLEFSKKDRNKILLSLSRRNRHHRVMAHSMLWNSELKDYSIISQDVLSSPLIDNATLNQLGQSQKQWKKFTKNLPLIADENKFHINEPFDLLPHLHNKTCFSIVNETLINDYNNTSMFFSEKILKPIVNFQPMIIYGQRGINHALCELGYKTYDDFFDLSFDLEKDNFTRYKKLLNCIAAQVKELAAMTIAQQTEWRFKYLDVLQYNYDVFLQQTHSRTAAKKFYKIISEF